MHLHALLLGVGAQLRQRGRLCRCGSRRRLGLHARRQVQLSLHSAGAGRMSASVSMVCLVKVA